MKTAVLLPCYNEAGTIGKLVSDFLAADPSVTVYVYDNNSTDGTGSIAEAAGAVVVREHRQGKGWVIRSMFRDVDADVYVMVDGDGTYDAAEALAMRVHVADGSADLVNGDRLSSNYFTENTRRFHGLGNRLIRFMVNSLFGSRVRDVMTGSRCMSRTFVKLFPVTTSRFEVEIDLTVHALDKGFLVREVPISYRERPDHSQSKLNTFSDGGRVLWAILRLFRDYRPMRFFGVVAAVLFAMSVAFFVPPLGEYLRTGIVTKFPTLLVSMALGLASLLALTCGVLLASIRQQSRQAYEHELTRFAQLDSLAREYAGAAEDLRGRRTGA